MLLLFIAAIVVAWFTNGGLGLVDGEVEVPQIYFVIFALIFGDAIIPILPGETTLNTAAVLASDRELELPLVILAAALGAVLGDRYAMLIVFGRYVPGLRIVINATMGITQLPYPKFLLWSTIEGVSWATYTALLAYYVGSALEDFPLGSILISGAITTILIGAIFLLERRRIKERPAEAVAD